MLNFATNRILAAGLLILATPVTFAQERVPGDVWLRFETPEEAGFSSEKLAEAKEYYDSLDAAAAMVIFDGAVLASWGDVERRLMCHSMRKSVMSAAWGVHVDRGEVDLSKTLAELGIDDMEPKLTEVEKRATILDLLKARSGVYRLAAYEPPQNPKPPRHSHEPGTFFCYNNWDFNTLLTMFEQEVGKDFFVDVYESLALPTGMRDYLPRHGYRHYERDKSIHPAYPIRMSARDLARFGTLFLREGRWGEQQVLSKEWVERCRTPYSETGRGGGYGLLWWTAGEEDLLALGMYSALGYGGHAVDVLPGANLVLVFRVNTFEGKSVSSGRRKRLLGKILAAKIGEPKEDPALVELEPVVRARQIPDAAIDAEAYVGELDVPPFGLAKVSQAEDGALVVGLPGRDTFDLIPLGGDRFLIADIETEMAFDRGPDGKVAGVIHPQHSGAIARELLQDGSTDEAMALLEKILHHFPDSATVHAGLGLGNEQLGQLQAARTCFERAIELGRSGADPALEQYEESLARVVEALGGEAPDYSTIDGTLETLYAAVSFGPGGECDWDRLREIFFPGAIFIQPPKRGEKRKVIDLEGFFADWHEFFANSTVRETGFVEKLAHRTTDHFGDIAHAYVVFEVRVDPDSPRPLARGMDSIQLVRVDDRWWVNSIITEFERPGRAMPERFVGGD